MRDILIRDEGTIFLFIPQTEEAEDWLVDHTDGTWFSGALVVEHRYLTDLAVGLAEAGFTLGDVHLQKRRLM